VRYVLDKGTSGNTRNGTSVQEMGKGKFKLPAIDRLKSATGLTDAVSVAQRTSSSATLNNDGTYDKSYTKTRESLAGVKFEVYAGDTLIREYTHGRIGK
jgi:hypothetical protein